MSTPSYLVNIRAIRSNIGTQILQEKVLEALEQVVIPEGWFIQRSASSMMYTRTKRRLPHVKVYYDRYRVDVDEGTGCNVKSTRQDFDTAQQMAAYVQERLWHFSQ